MAYDEFLAECITNILNTKTANFFSKKMMGDLVFMVNNKIYDYPYLYLNSFL